MNAQVFYSGRVQGVGFRYTVKQAAQGYEVTGWVRNLPDGRVELQVGEEPAEVEGFLGCIAQGQLAGYIKQVERAPLPDDAGRWDGFEIRH